MDYVTPLSYYIIPASSFLELKKRDLADINKTTRVAVQFEGDKSSVFFVFIILRVETV